MMGILRASAALVVVVAAILATSAPAEAHEQRIVGKYTVEVGWHDEPAIVDRPNSVFLEVKETATGRAITGLEKTITVTVAFGGLRAAFAPQLRAVFDEPGAYVADIIPTAAGDYTFRFTGKIDDQTVDEKFESGPGRFDSIAAASDLQYPQQAASLAELTRQLADLKSAIDQTRILSVVGVVLGLAGLGASVLLRRRA